MLEASRPGAPDVMAEENIHGYFTGELAADSKEAANYKRLGLPEGSYEWGKFHDRFDVSKDPNEANRFGWIVEVDVNDPVSVPKKRTSMGRFKHEERRVDRFQRWPSRVLSRR